MFLHHEGTKGTKGYEAQPGTRKKLLWGAGRAFVPFVSFVPSW
jgi:hypothetical protein